MATKNLWDDRGRCKCGVSLVAGRPGQGRGVRRKQRSLARIRILSVFRVRSQFSRHPNTKTKTKSVSAFRGPTTYHGRPHRGPQIKQRGVHPLPCARTTYATNLFNPCYPRTSCTIAKRVATLSHSHDVSNNNQST